MTSFQTHAEETLSGLMKQRTILNVQKKKRRTLYNALADAEALAETRRLYEEGLPGMEEEYARYIDAVALLDTCGIPRERLLAEKAQVYQELAEVNRQIRDQRKKLALCREIQDSLPKMQSSIEKLEMKEVIRDDYRRR